MGLLGDGFGGNDRLAEAAVEHFLNDFELREFGHWLRCSSCAWVTLDDYTAMPYNGQMVFIETSVFTKLLYGYLTL